MTDGALCGTTLIEARKSVKSKAFRLSIEAGHEVSLMEMCPAPSLPASTSSLIVAKVRKRKEWWSSSWSQDRLHQVAHHRSR
jgi:hypothetical protein